MTFLERVKWLDLYGADLHPVLGEDNVEYFLGLAPSGLIVLRNKSKVGNYFWPRVAKVYRKGKYFMTRILEKNSEEKTYGFRLPSKEASKHLWQCCVEHQAFFKLSQDKESLSKGGSKLGGFTQRFRYSSRGSFTRRANGQVGSGQVNLGLSHDRSPPTVVRVPSRRYQRRLGQPDGADAANPNKEEAFKENGYIEVRSSIVVPAGRHITQPVVYRTNSAANAKAGDSPKSARSVPWDNPRQRGLFSSSTNASPKSVRSARVAQSQRGTLQTDGNANHVDHNRSSSASRYRHGKLSDNESEVSKCSKSSRHSRHSNRSSSSRHRCRRRHDHDSGTESDSSRKRHRRRHKCCDRSSSAYKLVDSEQQWLEIQKRQNAQGDDYDAPRHSVAVLRDLNTNSRHASGYSNSGLESETELQTTLNRKKKQNLKTVSENGRRDLLPREIKKHIDYNFVDPSDNDKRDIRYTNVETDSRLFKIRYSPTTGRARGKLASTLMKSGMTGGSDGKSTGESSPSQGTPPPATSAPIYATPRALEKLSAVNSFHSGSQESHESASNSSNSVSRMDANSRIYGNPRHANDLYANTMHQAGNNYPYNPVSDFEKVDNQQMYNSNFSGDAERRAFLSNSGRFPGGYAIDHGYGVGSPPRVTFQTPPSTTAYYAADAARWRQASLAGHPNPGGRPTEMATEL